MSSFDLDGYMKEKAVLVNERLEAFVRGKEDKNGLYEAMEYSLMAGGKRLRPILALAGAEAVGGDAESVLPFAAALEFIHTYSLVHDDLPAMDDSDTRRGRPTSHKRFGEATAILTGDALLTHAFELMTDPAQTGELDPRQVQKVVCEVSRAIGVEGMIGGQAADLRFMGVQPGADDVEYIHLRKTAALIRISVWGGAVLGNASDSEADSIGRYGQNVGLAFQIADDILDETGDSTVLGKTAGSDQEAEKATYPKVFGLDQSRSLAQAFVDAALEELSGFGEGAEPVRSLAHFIVAREF